MQDCYKSKAKAKPRLTSNDESRFTALQEVPGAELKSCAARDAQKAQQCLGDVKTTYQTMSDE